MTTPEASGDGQHNLPADMQLVLGRIASAEELRVQNLAEADALAERAELLRKQAEQAPRGALLAASIHIIDGMQTGRYSSREALRGYLALAQHGAHAALYPQPEEQIAFFDSLQPNTPVLHRNRYNEMAGLVKKEPTLRLEQRRDAGLVGDLVVTVTDILDGNVGRHNIGLPDGSRTLAVGAETIQAYMNDQLFTVERSSHPYNTHTNLQKLRRLQLVAAGFIGKGVELETNVLDAQVAAGEAFYEQEQARHGQGGSSPSRTSIIAAMLMRGRNSRK